jgi:hypothetical protein
MWAVSTILASSRGLHLPNVHVFHAHYHVAGRVLEGAIEIDNVIRIAVVHDTELSYDSFPDLVLGFNMYDLPPISLASFIYPACSSDSPSSPL